ncbi:hypothetical protein [Ensifer aridi]|uniref:hypothetical protein n=1 Tax=Ensifer aridi TaxID=1708715 RepID=UPI000A113F90|nr:hypothetical protein [Ensifer aridi]
MKIVGVDNYGREPVADVLICENYVNDIVDALNAKSGENGSRFYRSAPDDYKLWRGMEELV